MFSIFIDEQRLSQDASQIKITDIQKLPVEEQVFDVQDTDDILLGILVYRDSGICLTFEDIDQLFVC